jgi:hypothetical protein
MRPAVHNRLQPRHNRIDQPSYAFVATRAEIPHRAGIQPSNINDLYAMANFILKTAAISMVFVRQPATLM